MSWYGFIPRIYGVEHIAVLQSCSVIRFTFLEDVAGVPFHNIAAQVV